MSDGKWYVTTRYQYDDEDAARRVYEDLNRGVGQGWCIGVTLSSAPERASQLPTDTPPHVYKRTVTARAFKWTGFAANIAAVVGFLHDEQSATFLMRLHDSGALHVQVAGLYGGQCTVQPDNWLVIEGGLPRGMADDEFQKAYQR